MKKFSNFVAFFGLSVGLGNRKGGFVTRIIPAIRIIAEKFVKSKCEIMNMYILQYIIYQLNKYYTRYIFDYS